MKRLAVKLSLVLAFLAVSPGLHAQSGGVAAAARSEPVELPPMMIEESVSGVPWLYVNAGSTEFLSRCTPSVTRQLAEAWLRKMQLVRVLIPGELLARMDVPEVFVLYSQDLQRTVSAEIQRELQSRAVERDKDGDSSGSGGVSVAPSMRLSDRDMHAAIAYIDETLFDASTLSISPNHVHYLLRTRVPELPGWYVDGMVRLWRRADFVTDPITLRPLVWINSSESYALAGDATRPRAPLPATELFATGAALAAENRHPRRMAARASTQELFVRWAIVSGGARREALGKLAALAAERPVSEELFQEIFGLDFAELRDRLSDYLPTAVDETKWISPGVLPPVPRVQVERATSNQIARLRGEWERLAIGYVQRRLPQVREPYIVQARTTLRRAYDAGDRDPRLLATLGLCEIDAGNEAAAPEFLEPAVALGVVRPRAYYELARLRFAALRRDAPEATSFSFGQLAPVIDPLRRALTQAPVLPEIFALLGDAWSRCELAPNAGELEELRTGARLFARRPTVAYSIARALARHDRKLEAAAVLDTCSAYATDQNTRASIAFLRTQLSAGPGQATGEP